MCSHHLHHPDYREITKYERKIEKLLNHNMHQYKYVGEDGREYDVVQSVFDEINQLHELSNRQIRWYAIIANLARSFYHRRIRIQNKGGFPDLSLLESTKDFKISSQGSTDAEGFQFSTDVEKSKPKKFFVPSFIGFIELYINEVARLGMLVCTKDKINPDYLDYKRERIHSLLTELLEDMGSKMKDENGEEVFILTIKNAAENVTKLEKSLSKDENRHSIGSGNAKLYQELIVKRINGIAKERLANYYNMEAFWNGFIP